MKIPLFKIGWAALVLMTLQGCGQGGGSRDVQWFESKAGLMAKLTGDPYWEKRWWLDKTARLLRGGEGLGPEEDVDALMKLSEDKIVDHFMSDPRFAETVLDFNMHFLGYKMNTLHIGPNYNPFVFEFASAVASTQELMKGGDYFKIFDLFAPAYIAPSPPMTPDPADPSQAGKNSLELRTMEVEKYQALLTELMKSLEAQPPADPIKVCDVFETAFDSGRKITQLGVVSQILQLTVSRAEPNWYEAMSDLCAAARNRDEKARPQPAQLAAALRSIIARDRLFFNELFKFDPVVYQPKSPTEFKVFDLKGIGVNAPWLSFGLEQRSSLPNSSTNFNRKRGAYVLKQFFCDDLTPIGIENPSEHSGGQHGSDASCRTCHYKLDPMAGFFRAYGIFYFDFSQQTNILFDDLASMGREKYWEQWRAPAGSGRAWNVGYIRSVKSSTENEYGESLTDLTRIIRGAREAKRCLVKRIFEYAVSEGQAFDAGYVSELTDEVVAKAVTDPSGAFKHAFKRAILSNTYRTPDPMPQECYDYRTGHKPGDTPPCKVAFLLETNCKSCHSSTSGPGRIDLTRWITLPDGTKNFPHLRGGQQVETKHTFAAIIDRLSTSDPQKRMPLMKSMTPTDRQDVYHWAQEIHSSVTGAR